MRLSALATCSLALLATGCEGNATPPPRQAATAPQAPASANPSPNNSSSPGAPTAPGAASPTPAQTSSSTAAPIAESPTMSQTTPTTTLASTPSKALATFGAGCFWGVEHIFKDVPGVLDAVSGYTGGDLKNPTYEQICRGNTGHVEVVQVTYDPAKVSFESLVDIFFRLHDPTQVNRQGPDVGDQYRSVIFYHDDAQKLAAEKIKTARAPKHKKPIATSIEPAETFYKAEDYHQDYYVKTGKEPYCHFLREE